MPALEQMSDKSLGSNLADILSTALNQCPSVIEIPSMHLATLKYFEREVFPSLNMSLTLTTSKCICAGLLNWCENVHVYGGAILYIPCSSPEFHISLRLGNFSEVI